MYCSFWNHVLYLVIMLSLFWPVIGFMCTENILKNKHSLGAYVIQTCQESGILGR